MTWKYSVGVLAALTFVLCSALSTRASAQAPVLPCAGVETDVTTMLSPNRDDGAVEVSLAPIWTVAAPFQFGGQSFSTMFINTNGSVTFGVAETSFTPTALPGLDQPTIAPHFADVDLRSSPGRILFCTEPLNDRVLVTWEAAPHYNSGLAVNTYQLVLTAAPLCGINGVLAQFRYADLNWYVGQASGGNPQGVCNDPQPMNCIPAAAGVDYGDTVTAVQLPDSLTTEVNQTLLTGTNSGTPGVWEIEINPSAVPSCGNGTLEVCEECDAMGATSDCDDDCTFVACGDGTTNAAAGEQCDDGGVQPGDGCSATCQLEECGNSTVDPGEECDGGGTDTAACDADCTLAECGDGTTNAAADEQCDDGNTADFDGCSSTCQTMPQECGNGGVETPETCDDGNTTAGDGCSELCATENGFSCPTPNAPCTTTCGDSIPAGAEDCDEGGVDTATCDGDCTTPMCGDSRTNAAFGESCDEGGAQSATCEADCSTPACGDGTRNALAGEACDDGNTTSGDGCSATCENEGCGDSVVNSAEECDEGGVNSATCDDDCTFAVCGDSHLNAAASEACDTGGASATCDDDCTAPECGDGNLNAQANEACDDGSANSNTTPNACRLDCTEARCGDGVVDDGEQCDGGESCDSSCRSTGDAGPSQDGGTTGRDAGVPGADAGGQTDAGVGADAGAGGDAGLDAGPVEAVGLTGGGLCGVSPGSQPLGAGVLWVLAGALLLRRRRR